MHVYLPTGKMVLKKKGCRDQVSPQVTIERYLKRLLFMLLCFWATAAEDPSRRTTDLRGEPGWIPPAARARMAFITQQLLRAMCRFSAPSLLPALVSLPHRAVPCFEPVVIRAGDKLCGSFVLATLHLLQGRGSE